MYFRNLYLKAQNPVELPGGIISLSVTARELSGEENKVLETLFPNLRDRLDKLLMLESLLASTPTDSEIDEAHRKHSEQEKPYYPEIVKAVKPK